MEAPNTDSEVARIIAEASRGPIVFMYDEGAGELENNLKVMETSTKLPLIGQLPPPSLGRTNPNIPVNGNGPYSYEPSHCGPYNIGPNHYGPYNSGPSHYGPYNSGPSHYGPYTSGPSHYGPYTSGLNHHNSQIPLPYGPVHSVASSGRPAPYTNIPPKARSTLGNTTGYIMPANTKLHRTVDIFGMYDSLGTSEDFRQAMHPPSTDYCHNHHCNTSLADSVTAANTFNTYEAVQYNPSAEYVYYAESDNLELEPTPEPVPESEPKSEPKPEPEPEPESYATKMERWMDMDDDEFCYHD